jgi:c-di-GMP-binding flagellar brake protein YcgR
MAPLEQRVHPRIFAPLRAYVTDGCAEPVEVAVRDLSECGAFLLTPRPRAWASEPLRIELLAENEASRIFIRCEVVRIETGPSFGAGVRFLEMEEAQRERLSELLGELLKGSGGRRRSHARMALRMDVRCTGNKPFRAVLRDVSYGGASLWSNKLVELGAPLTLAFERRHRAGFRVSGRVVCARRATKDQSLHQLGVRFDHSAPALRAEIDSMLITRTSELTDIATA